MGMAKKGSRRITVNEMTYRWRVSRWRRLSGWKPADLELLDPRWLEQARRLGLGDVADVVFNIAIELYEEPAARILVKYYAKVVDGFLGIEQLTQVKPQLVREIIERALASRWDPRGRTNHDVELVENSGDPRRPVLLLLPGWDDAGGYENRMVPLEIWTREEREDDTN